MKEFVHPNDDTHVDTEHMRFITKNGIVYASTEEQMHRRSIFMQNLRFIHSKNRANLGYTLSVNHLADKSDEEIKVLRGYHSSGKSNGGGVFPYVMNASVLADLPDDYDWRLYGAVTPVKDQSVCGSCWSFGSTVPVEGAQFLKTGDLVHVSSQALVDCSWGYGNNGNFLSLNHDYIFFLTIWRFLGFLLQVVTVAKIFAYING